MDPFTYEPIDLEGSTFRLLRLCKGEGSVVECELFQAWVHNADTISYEALSYTWGSNEMSSSIEIDGRTLHVTDNLYIVLQYLRLQEEDRILWVDAVCIDQTNMLGRGHQVQQMGKIYSQAEQVVFWLGPATNETVVLLDSLKQLEKESIDHPCKDWPPGDRRWNELWSPIQLALIRQDWDLLRQQRVGLEFLLGKPWFRRVWILQEVVNTKRALVYSGTKSVSARVFALAPLLIGLKPESHCQAVLDIMPGMSRKYSWWNQNRNLHTLLVKFKQSQASDSRDRLYALLGISSDGKSDDRLRADYTKTPQEVVHDLCSFLFGRSDRPYDTIHTLSQVINQLVTLDTAMLPIVTRYDSCIDVTNFLDKIGPEVKITENTFEAAVQNPEEKN